MIAMHKWRWLYSRYTLVYLEYSHKGDRPMRHDDVKKILLEDPVTRLEYEKLRPRY